MQSKDVRNNGTFRWSGEKDILLLREVRYVEPYKFKHGTKESGQAWNEVANGVNKHEGFKAMPRDQRSVRDRFNKLLADFNAKMRKEEGESGTNPEPLSEAETILEEIEEKILSAKVDLASATAKDSEQQKNERKKAMAVRDAALNTWAKSKCADSDEEDSESEKPRKRKRRRGNDGLQYLEAKCQAEADVKKEEVALRQQELALQQKRQEQFEAQMLQQQQYQQQQALQQQQQFNLQQQQFQQTQNLIIALLEKMSSKG